MTSNLTTPAALINTDGVVNAVRYTVRTMPLWVTFCEENSITRETIAPTANALAALAYPTDEQIQRKDGKRTRYGNAVQAAASMMRKALATDDDDDTPKPVVLRVSLSGEGGGSTVVEPTHPLYNSIVALLAPTE